MSKPILQIDIYTDPHCPWCEIGHHVLSSVLQSADFRARVGAHMTPRVRINPYLLDGRLPSSDRDALPTPPYDPVDATPYEARQPPSKKAYYSGKFPGASLDAFDRKIGAKAEEIGLPKFEWDTEGKAGASWDAHRLLLLAGEKEDAAESSAASDASTGGTAYKENNQVRLVSTLYADYHHRSQDLSSHAYLARLAVAHALFRTEAEALTWLQSDALEDELVQKLRMTDMLGVRGIPFVVVQDGSDHLSGSGDHAAFMRMFTMAASLHT